MTSRQVFDYFHNRVERLGAPVILAANLTPTIARQLEAAFGACTWNQVRARIDAVIIYASANPVEGRSLAADFSLLIA